MLRVRRLMTLVAVLCMFVCGTVIYGAEKRDQAPPKKEVSKKEAPKKEDAKKETGVVRKIPSWTSIEGKEVAEKGKESKAKGTLTVFDEFPKTASCKGKKLFAIYLYWPESDKTDAKASKDCAAFEKALAAATEVEKVLKKDFTCYKCDAQKLGKELKKKYAARVPTLLVFDANGKEIIKETSFPTSEKTLLNKLEKLKKAAEKGDAKKDKEKIKEKAKESSKTSPKK